LILTALTLVLGTNPNGDGLQLWLGCCGVYLQPSEPLKLLFIIYLAAYLADRLPLSLRPLHLIAPTAVVMGIALLLLVIQRDLGTASIFIFLYTSVLFLASGKKRILLMSLGGLAVAGLAGYFLFDVVRLRVEAWINPWLDPSGRSFQIVQSLMAVANGGTIGRGPGLGSPGLVPVAISDFIYTSMAEETGLSGSLALLAVVGFLVVRGLRVALRAPDNFRRILAGGLSAYLAAQTVLIVGGNIRLLPLTGVTLPFVSYGGSSLLTSMLALLLLLIISGEAEEEPAAVPSPQPYLWLSGLVCLFLSALAVTTGWWAVWRGPDLLERTDNARRSIADRYVKRGSLLDQSGIPINYTDGASGEYQRVYAYPELSPIVGYTNPVYGQAGLEASLDGYLRGLQGNTTSSIWWDHLVYGQPPPGVDVRLSIDLDLQQQADALLGAHAGALILLNAATGEILVMASHPTFDPAAFDRDAAAILNDPAAPLFDRAAQGMYPPGNALQPFLEAASLAGAPPQTDRSGLYAALGFFNTPQIRLRVAPAVQPGQLLRISPLQMALATAALCSDGIRPPGRLAAAVRTPTQGWVILPALGEPVTALEPGAAASSVGELMVSGQAFWQWTSTAGQGEALYTWSIGGTPPGWNGTALAVVVLLEGSDTYRATVISRTLLGRATLPK
jgi:cell division protein FtsW (lipid II flippase)